MSRNRQIKIRIWDKQNKKWLAQGVDVFSETMLFYLTMVEDYSNFQISQYTGLKDKNGHEIWEGDYFLNHNWLYTINYTDNKFSAEFEMGYIEFHDLYDIYKKGDNCVVGNIYEDDFEDLLNLIPFLIAESKLNDAQKSLVAKNAVWNEKRKIFRLIKGKTFRLIEMKVTVRSKYWGQYDEYRGSISLEETERIYAQSRHYLAVPPEWFQDTDSQICDRDYRFTNHAKDKIYTTIFKELWTSRKSEINKSFFAQTIKGEQFFQIETNQVEPDFVSNINTNPHLYIFLEDYTLKTPSLFDTKEFLQKGNFTN